MASAATPPEANGHTTPGDHELDEMADKKSSLPVEEDIMQLARLGEIGAIQKLFDGGKFDATYKDEQGITPLHVRTQPTTKREICMGTNNCYSGQPSTTTTPSATSSSKPAHPSTQKAEMPLQRPSSGLLSAATTTS